MALTIAGPKEKALRVRQLAHEHHEYRAAVLNLGCAEILTSALVREMLATDFGRRYGTKGGYSGGRFLDEVEDIGEGLAQDLFHARYAILNPLSGHVALETVLLGLADPGDTVMTLAQEDGGYPFGIAGRLGLNVVNHGFDANALNIDVEVSRERILQARPKIVLFGASRYLFPHPVAGLIDACHEVGATVCYDGSHPLGLIAGGAFDEPFAEGVDVLFGSTSKTLFGPTRGILLVRDSAEIRARLNDVYSHVLVQSTYHLNSLAALVVALAETTEFGREYAAAVVANARALAQGLTRCGVPVLGMHDGGSRSQLVLLEAVLRDSPEEKRPVQRRLERAGIMTDRHLRLGVQQVTRLGMGTAEMDAIAAIIADVIHTDDADTRTIGASLQAVRDLASKHRTLRYTFDGREDAFGYPSIADIDAN